MILSVIFDIGETIRDDTREFGAWADWLGVPRHTFSAVFGATRAAGGSTDDVFQLLRPGFELSVERSARLAVGIDEHFEEEDLYPDVRPALAGLRDAGFWTGIAGNQSARARALLQRLDLPVDAITTSETLRAAKPSPLFFARLAAWANRPAAEVLYVGDHRDFDIRPAKAAGMSAALIRRGPFGYLWADEVRELGDADLIVSDLVEIVGAIPAPSAKSRDRRDSAGVPSHGRRDTAHGAR